MISNNDIKNEPKRRLFIKSDDRYFMANCNENSAPQDILNLNHATKNFNNIIGKLIPPNTTQYFFIGDNFEHIWHPLVGLYIPIRCIMCTKKTQMKQQFMN